MPPDDHLPLTTSGRLALSRLGSRVYAVYTGAAVVGLLVTHAEGRVATTAATAAAALTSWWWVLPALGAAVAGGRLVGSLAPGTTEGLRPERRRVLGLVAAQLALLLVVLGSAPPAGWETRFLLSWLVGGAALGTALAAGPAWGIGTLAVLDGAYAVTWTLAGHGVDPAVLADTPVSVAVGCVVHVGASRGFARSQAATRAARDARRAVDEAERDLAARRALDRELHDTLLSTLALVSLGPPGEGRDGVRDVCSRDLHALRTDRWGSPPSLHGPKDAGPGTGRLTLTALVEEVRTEACAAGLEVRTYVVASQELMPAPACRAAWQGAVAECLANVRRHAGVDAADLVVDLSDGDLLTLVVDEGVGFDPDGVGTERLGLASSVKDRVAAVGGRVTVRSAVDRGTVVEVRIPLETA